MVSIGVIRELLGNGTIFGVTILGAWYNPALIMILPPGAFILIGYMVGAIKLMDDKKEKKLKEREI
jgi:electron transport complex protein RnfE